MSSNNSLVTSQQTSFCLLKQPSYCLVPSAVKQESPSVSVQLEDLTHIQGGQS